MDMNAVFSTANGDEIPLAMLAGPRLLGMFFNWFLLGVLFVQVYIFYLTFAGESNRIRVLVYILLLVETLQTFLMTSDAFHWFVFGWGERERLNDIQTKWLNVPLMSGLISGTVQTFFGWQILRVSKSYYMPCLIFLISLMQSSAAVATGVKVKLANQLSRAVFVPVVINHTGEAVADVFISISMTYLLFRMKSGFKSTDKRLVNIIRLFVETGLITSTVAVLDVIFFFLFPTGTLHECPALMLPKLYSNALLALLNNRIFSGKSESDFETPSSRILRSNDIRSGPRNANVTTGIRVEIQQSTVTDIPLDDFRPTESSRSDEHKAPYDEHNGNGSPQKFDVV